MDFTPEVCSEGEEAEGMLCKPLSGATVSCKTPAPTEVE